MIGGSNRSIRFQPIDWPSATVFHAAPGFASTAYFWFATTCETGVLAVGYWQQSIYIGSGGCFTHTGAQKKGLPLRLKNPSMKLRTAFITAVKLFVALFVLGAFQSRSSRMGFPARQ